MNTESTLFEGIVSNPSILRALAEEGYKTPTEIQQSAIPEALAGKDVMATAQTGTGKTAAFSVPILNRLHARPHERRRQVRALILAPTRELALQIKNSFDIYGKHLPLKTAVVMGGVSSGPQIKALHRGVDILIATPGRLLDLFKRNFVSFKHIEVFVLDEADRMMDMGFLPDVRRIVAQLPRKRQTLFFSATISSVIAELASNILNNPVKIEVAPSATVAVNIDQRVCFVRHADKDALLKELLKKEDVERTLIFTRTRRGAERIVKCLEKTGIKADAIHSSKSQGARQRALAAFDKGHINVLIGTDIIARGIDVDGISHVINFEIPEDPENYVHRIGRTARAGAKGVAMSFCDRAEIPMLRGIEKLTKSTLEIHDEHSWHAEDIASMRTRYMKRKVGTRSFRPRGRRRRR